MTLDIKLRLWWLPSCLTIWGNLCGKDTFECRAIWLVGLVSRKHWDQSINLKQLGPGRKRCLGVICWHFRKENNKGTQRSLGQWPGTLLCHLPTEACPWCRLALLSLYILQLPWAPWLGVGFIYYLYESLWELCIRCFSVAVTMVPDRNKLRKERFVLDDDFRDSVLSQQGKCGDVS